MERRIQEADHIVCVISKEYLKKSFSSWERRSAEWAVAAGRENFVLPVYIEDCEAPILLAPLKSCFLFGVEEEEARKRLSEYLAPSVRPSGNVPVSQIGFGEIGSFPGRKIDFAPVRPTNNPSASKSLSGNIMQDCIAFAA
jgi:hypothetical protein